ncbi:invasin domain 3-containing protein [Sulfoacidibacillus ferrooxidans]|uniref:S-layer homology domain-containing protein n=1 Tax=Sulfoacidibacillus ferrooxidans TaxID=2005001 RepID=A0A9X2AEJ1_9BACL|nr:invasin domain 3-containing protein [Sulfoacidibacillus ferrooxidans]MCI0183402.1 hypothetical protein [Sulfoacidibacillus ferrooxidans]
MKRTLSSIAAAALVLGTVAPAAFAATSSTTYTDLGGYSWAANDINSLTSQGYIHGFSNGQFRPGDLVTRGQFLAYFMNAMKDVTGVGPSYSGTYFKDVQPGNWAYEYVGAAQKAGWIKPYWINVRVGGNFDENYQASRGDAASFFVAAMEKAGVISSTHGMTPLTYANSIGLFKGIPSGQNGIYFNRAAAAVVLQNMINFVNGGSTAQQSMASKVTLSLSSSSINANGTSTDTVTATVVDANGNPVSGATVNFASSNISAATVQSSATTNGSGVATATITAGNTAGSTAITASVEGVTGATALTVIPSASTLSNIGTLTVTGQTVGTGTLASPAVSTVNNGVTVALQMQDSAGNIVVGSNLQFLVSTTDNVTATANSELLSASTLNAPVVMQNHDFTAEYSVPTNAQGIAEVTFDSAASSTQPLYVMVQGPYSVDGTATYSNQVVLQWGLPGNLVLTPLYESSSDPEQASYSDSSNPTRGMIPVVATVLPESGVSVAGQTVRFTLNLSTASSAASSVFFTDSTGQNPVVGGQVLTPGDSVTYQVQTGSNGQATAYVNANVPTENGTPLIGSNTQASVSAELVNGGGSTSDTYLSWANASIPTQVSNVAPSDALNSGYQVGAQNFETPNSGTQLTLQGTAEDAAGNPAADVPLVITDQQDPSSSSATMASSNGTDSFVVNGTTTPFSPSSFDEVMTNAQGNFTFTVTDTVQPQQPYQSDQYYVYEISQASNVVEGQTLPAGLQQMEIDGSSDGAYNVTWIPGQTVGVLGLSNQPLSSSYSSVSAVPNSFTDASSPTVSGIYGTMFFGVYSSDGQAMIGQQYSNYQTNYDINAGSGYSITQLFSQPIDSYFSNYGPTLGSVSNGVFTPFFNVQAVDLQVNGNGQWTITSAVANTTAGGTYSTYSTGLAFGQSGSTTTTAATGTGAGASIELRVNTSNNPNATDVINGGTATVNISASVTDPDAVQGNDAEGGASGTATVAFVPQYATTSLSMVNDYQQNVVNDQSLWNTDSSPASAVSLQGTSYTSGYARPDQSFFNVVPFNDTPNVATVPTSGMTYNVTATAGGVESVDGIKVQNSPAQSATISINNAGAVQVNNSPLWNAPSDGSTIVGYATSGSWGTESAPSNPNVYVLSKTTSGTYEVWEVGTNGTLSMVASAPALSNIQGGLKELADGAALDWTIADGQLSVNYNNNIGPGSLVTGTAAVTADNSAALPSSLTFKPVQVAYIGGANADAGTQNFTVTVAGSDESSSAKGTASVSYNGGTSGLYQATATPANISGQLNSPSTIQIEAQDIYGNALPDQSLTVSLANQLYGVWITGVNSTQLMSNVNMSPSGSQSDYQTEPTPIPLFSGSGAAYGSVSGTGIAASGIQAGSPTIYLTTGTAGTVSLTLQDGAVPYIEAGSSSTVAPQYQVSTPYAVSGDLVIDGTESSSGVTQVVTVPVTWPGNTAPSATTTATGTTSGTTSGTTTTTPAAQALAFTMANSDTLTSLYVTGGPNGGVSLTAAASDFTQSGTTVTVTAAGIQALGLISGTTYQLQAEGLSSQGLVLMQSPSSSVSYTAQ